MATVPALQDNVEAVEALLARLIQVRQIRDPLAHLHPDMTGPQIHVIACLAVAQRPVAMTELAHRICASAPTMTGVVDRLERQGLVSRERDGEDRRVVHIALTEAGAAVFETLREDCHEKLTNLLGCLSPDEQSTFVSLISRIVDRLQSMSEGAVDGHAHPPPEKPLP